MSTALTLPDGVRPSNLHLGPGTQHVAVEADMYGICERIKEVDPSLHVVLLSSDDKWCFAIMELCADGVERLVFKVKELDERVIAKLRRLMALPLKQRLARLEKDEFKFYADKKERELDELYEQLGRPMWTQLERCGFIQRPVSYPKLGVAAPGRTR